MHTTAAEQVPAVVSRENTHRGEPCCLNKKVLELLGWMICGESSETRACSRLGAAGKCVWR